ncbi:MAG TPA: hypothetical protein VFX84_02870 [Candidatus Saccharimonadales bacterium]|nr:hypothetical protein [Candidatus Saccharimonadales bacterium]
MMSGNRASSLLVALVATIMLFSVFAAAINVPLLANYSYDLDYGWQAEAPSALANERTRECPNPARTAGFPITTSRPADNGLACFETNTLAKYMNLALCFAAASIIAVAIATATRNR